MTKKARILLYFIIIVAFFLKEEVYGFLMEKRIRESENNSICQIKNEVLEEKYQELVTNYGYDDVLPYTLEHSKVLYKDIYNLNKQITIYKGSNQNVQENNLVINEKGLVGIVRKVNKNSSVVDLLEKDGLNLSVKINNSYGILKYKNQELIVEGISSKEKIDKEDKVYTSDLSIYPEKVLIGTIKSTTNDEYDIEKKIKITPAVLFEQIKYVSIITNTRGES